MEIKKKKQHLSSFDILKGFYKWEITLQTASGKVFEQTTDHAMHNNMNKE